MQKGKMFSEEALKMAEKRREAKGKEEKERYTHLSAEFQRVARFSTYRSLGRYIAKYFILFIAVCKASSDNHFVYLHFFFLEMVLITTS